MLVSVAVGEELSRGPRDHGSLPQSSMCCSRRLRGCRVKRLWAWGP